MKPLSFLPRVSAGGFFLVNPLTGQIVGGQFEEALSLKGAATGE